jgi:autotransporter-associated beta strand protein
MKNHRYPLLAFITLNLCGASAADLNWDGGTANIAAAGDGLSTYSGGTWSTGIANWDQGAALAHVAWNNANLDNAIFGGTYSTGLKTVAIGSNITVNQIQILTGSTGGNRYDIGGSNTQNDFAITFGGTYSDTFPSITGNNGFANTNFNAKVTGTINGGLVIKHSSNITTPGSSGRFGLTNANNNFVGPITLLGGNMSAGGASWGAATNKVILKGGSLFISAGAAVVTVNNRDIEVAAASGISTNATVSGVQALELGGAITGSANLTRYSSVTGTSISDVRFLGDMSGYTGTFENTGSSANARVTVQTTATSGGTWKLSGGTLWINTASANTAIANGAGKSDVLMNGGILDLNGKEETINGLSGAAGIVQSNADGLTGTLTFGDADTTATFGGTLRNNPGGAATGKLGITKTGGGTQTLAGSCNHTGPTLVSAGKLMVTSDFGDPLPEVADSSVTVADGAVFGVKLLASGLTAAVDSLATGGSSGSTILLDTQSFGSTTPLEILDATTFTPGVGASTLIHLRGYDFAVGRIPLIKYSILNGAGFPGLTKQLPYRVVGELANNTAESVIELNITSAESAVWEGDVNGDWDVNPDADGSAGTYNWKTSVSNTDTRYAQGLVNTDQVTFDGTATGTSNINLTTTLTPLNVRVKNPTGKPYTFTGTGKLSGETALIKDDDGTLVLANPTPYDFTGGTTVLMGILQLGNGVTPGLGLIGGPIFTDGIGAKLVLNYAENLTLGNLLTGNGEVIKTGANTLTVSQPSPFNGDFVLSKGSVEVAAGNALGGAFVLLGDADTGGDSVTLTLNNRADITNSISVTPNGTGTAVLAASNTGSGTNNPATFGGLVSLDRPTTLRNEIAGDTLAFTGVITGNVGTLTIDGGQVVSLQSTSNNFVGDIAVTGAGTVLQAGPTTGSEFLPDTSSVSLEAGTFLRLAGAGSTSETIAGLSGGGTVQRTVTGLKTLVVGTGDVSSTFDGLFAATAGVLGLTKTGTGTLTLTAANTYAGSTTIEAGTLEVNGSITSLVLPTGGTIGGSGTVGGINATGTGKVSPGTPASIATLSAIGNVTFNAGTEFTAQINSNGTPTADKLAVTGNLLLGAGVATLNLSDLGNTTLATTTTLVLATASGTITGTFAGLDNNSEVVVGSNTYKIRYDDTVGPFNAITLTHSAGGGYGAWASSNGVGTADSDDDNDGVENGVEYVLGTNPKAGNGTGITTSVTSTEFKFSFARNDASETPDTAVWIETSNDLANWNSDGGPHSVGAASNGNVTIVENPAAPAADPGTDAVTLTLPRNSATKFARLRVVVTP